MQAAWRERYGGPEVVEIRELPDPVPVEDQVLVRTHAASVNRADLDGLYPRWRLIRLLIGVRAPRERRLGIDMAGVVEAVGPAVTGIRPGDRVMGDLYATGMGAFAELACARQRAFAVLPDGVSFEDAATLPHSAILALQGLRLPGGRELGPGDRVLVVGASGNVGPFAVQLAKARGAHVTGVASGAKADLVRSLGADEVVDYTTTDPSRTGERYDRILDVDGHLSLLQARRALRPGGSYATLGGSGRRILLAMLAGPLVSLLGRRRVGLLLAWKPFHAPDVATILRAVADGTVRPAIDRRYPLAETAEALRRVDDGHARGKVLVVPDAQPAGSAG